MAKAIAFLAKFPLFYYCFWVNALIYFMLPFPTISASMDDQFHNKHNHLKPYSTDLTKAGFLTFSALPPSAYVVNGDDREVNRFLNPSAPLPRSYEGNNDMRQQTPHIGYGALDHDRIPCYHHGASYLCRVGPKANRYNRGCNPAIHCRNDPGGK